MSVTTSFTTSFTVDQTPDEVFAAINDVRSWWTGDIDGSSEQVGDVFSYRYEDLHVSKQEVTELVPGARVVWAVVDSDLSFSEHRSEWTGTRLVFEIAARDGRAEVCFTHEGLVPALACFDACAPAWTHYVAGSLRDRIASS